MLYPEETIQSQYAASPVIRGLIESINSQIDPRADIQLFFEKIFNPETAVGVGLDIWGRIVGVSRTLKIVLSEDYFGFIGTPALPSGWKPFNQGIFYEEGNENIGMYDLDDEAFRRLIFWKALANISKADLSTLNDLIGRLLSLPVYIVETGVMQLRLVFPNGLDVFQKAILEQYGLFGKGAGVGVEMLSFTGPVFSFVDDDSSTAIFGQAPFYNGSIMQLNSENE